MLRHEALDALNVDSDTDTINATKLVCDINTIVLEVVWSAREEPGRAAGLETDTVKDVNG